MPRLGSRDVGVRTGMGDQAPGELDTIVVGGGSAGASLAADISTRPRNRVLLIESGRDTPPGGEPKGVLDPFFAYGMQPENLWPGLRVHWRPVTANDPAAATATNKGRYYEQGHILGGGSSVNATIANRAMPGDFAEWVAAGATGWGWDDVLPHYRRLERDLDFAGPDHGQDGPIPIRRHRREDWPLFCRALVAACEDAGAEFIADMNTDFRDGYCAVPMSSLPDRRVSAAIGFLDAEARRRDNLHILTGTRVTGLTFDGRRCTGVTVGERAYQAREVVLSAGALQSPTLLLRAGIGPAEELRALGIAVLRDLAGVGRNLREHPTLTIAAHLKREAVQPAHLRAHANVGLRYSSGLPGGVASDMYVAFSNKTTWHPLGLRIGALTAVLHKPHSRGRLFLRSTDPGADPRIEFDTLADPRDMARMKDAMRRCHALLAHASVTPVINEVFPASYGERVQKLHRHTWANWAKSGLAAWLMDGPAPLRRALVHYVICPDADMGTLMADDAALEEWIDANVSGFFHPSCTCRMGAPDDPGAVVDPAGRVHGIDGLRVADASVMPSLVRAPTNLTSIMIGLKTATAILEEA